MASKIRELEFADGIVVTGTDLDAASKAYVDALAIKLPSDTYANLVALSGKAEGQLYYATDFDKVYFYDGSALQPVGSETGSVVYAASASRAVAAGDHVLADTTSGTITLTLPASPAIGNRVTIQDAMGTWSSTLGVTVDRNGKKIHGASADLTLTTQGDSVTLIYNGVDDWRIL